MTYVVITFVVLLILNLYCSGISQMVFYQSKEASMIEKCQLASDEIAAAEVLNTSTVSGIVNKMDSLKVTRMIVTDQRGIALYDSQQRAVGSYALLPEILQALGKNELGTEGNDVFSWNYKKGVMISRAATPITYYGSIIGCVYMMEYDTAQGTLIQTCAVAGMVPTGVTGCDQGSVIQGDDARDTEVLAAAGAGSKGLGLGVAIGRLFRDVDCENTHGQDAHQHAHGQDNGKQAFHFVHFVSSF